MESEAYPHPVSEEERWTHIIKAVQRGKAAAFLYAWKFGPQPLTRMTTPMNLTTTPLGLKIDGPGQLEDRNCCKASTSQTMPSVSREQ